MTTDSQTSTPATAIPCQTCHQGTLERKKVHRMSKPVVVIGFIILIPSAIGLLICILGLLFSVMMGKTAVDMGLAPNDKQALQTAGVPAPIIAKIDRGEQLTQAERKQLTSKQLQAISKARLNRSGTKGVGGLLGAAGTVVSVVGAFVTFFAGLIGWLLIMKKRVLQCANCSAVVNAS